MLFSIIIPLYNVEEYLEKCLDSVLCQTETDYEIILVDDGSTDSSPAICDRYAERYPDRIRVIHQPNNGQGGARNTGLTIAQGDYILFLDSDDYYYPESLLTIRKAIEKYTADVVLFDLCVENNGVRDQYMPENVDYPVGLRFAPEEYPSVIRKTIVTIEAWKRRVFFETDIRFESKVWFEDLRIAPKLVASARSVAAIQEPLYVYVQREGSTMHNVDISRNRELMDAFDDLTEWFQQRGLWEKYEGQIRHMAIEQIVLSAFHRIIDVDVNHPLLGEMTDYMAEAFPGYWKDPAATRSAQRRVFITLARFKQFRLLRLMLSLRDALMKVKR